MPCAPITTQRSSFLTNISAKLVHAFNMTSVSSQKGISALMPLFRIFLLFGRSLEDEQLGEIRIQIKHSSPEISFTCNLKL